MEYCVENIRQRFADKTMTEKEEFFWLDYGVYVDSQLRLNSFREALDAKKRNPSLSKEEINALVRPALYPWLQQVFGESDIFMHAIRMHQNQRFFLHTNNLTEQKFWQMSDSLTSEDRLALVRTAQDLNRSMWESKGSVLDYYHQTLRLCADIYVTRYRAQYTTQYLNQSPFSPDPISLEQAFGSIFPGRAKISREILEKTNAFVIDSDNFNKQMWGDEIIEWVLHTMKILPIEVFNTYVSDFIENTKYSEEDEIDADVMPVFVSTQQKGEDKYRSLYFGD